LNSKAANEIHWHCEHYKGRGVMKYFASTKELCMEMDISEKTLEKTFTDYNTVAAKQIEDPDGGPYDAYGGGKSWDEWGKKFFHNLPLAIDDEYHEAIVTPVIHYCMAGSRSTRTPMLLTRRGGLSRVSTLRAKSPVVCMATTALAETRCSTALSSAAFLASTVPSTCLAKM
jgi:hypothetical protein